MLPGCSVISRSVPWSPWSAKLLTSVDLVDDPAAPESMPATTIRINKALKKKNRLLILNGLSLKTDFLRFVYQCNQFYNFIMLS